MTASTLAGVCRADHPALHPLCTDEILALNARLRLDGVPVTVRRDGPGYIILWPALALTSRQMAHTLHVVTRATDSPVRWAGA